MKKETAEKILKMSEKEYDEYASEFSNSRQFFWDELKFLKEYVNSGNSVLDIGCGNGRLSDLFKNEDIDYTGIDFSKQLIEIAKKERGKNGTFVQATALDLPFKDSSFDKVFSIAVLHHIPSKEKRDRFISEAHRVLKPNGICVLTVWNTFQSRFIKTHLEHSLKKVLGRSNLDFGDMIIPFGKQKRQRYIHSFTKTGLRRLFEKSGFSNISVQKVKRKSGQSNLVIIAQKNI
ncbi:MAG: class I SAM-dependent methyltransferase [Candidatus Paceibacterota bacterium]